MDYSTDYNANLSHIVLNLVGKTGIFYEFRNKQLSGLIEIAEMQEPSMYDPNEPFIFDCDNKTK